MNTKAETFNPSALLKVTVKDKGVGTLDFCEVGEIKLKMNNGMVTVLRFDKNDDATVYRDKNGYINVDWYLKDFDKAYFEKENPLTRPNWSYLVTSDIEDIAIDIFHNEDSDYKLNPVAITDIKIKEFSILVKEESGKIAVYPFLDEQLDKFMKEVKSNATSSL